MVWLVIILLCAALIFFLFRFISFTLSPERRLAMAQRRGNFYLLDKKENVRMNFLLTYKGHLFEGEKYATGTTVDHILVWMTDPYNTKLSNDDVTFIHQTIQNTYPYAKIEYKKHKE